MRNAMVRLSPELVGRLELLAEEHQLEVEDEVMLAVLAYLAEYDRTQAGQIAWATVADVTMGDA